MLQPGDTISWQRAITEEDIAAFAAVSGDKGIQHISQDDQGRLMAHGLLTATLPTKIGGDLSFIAKTMTFEFIRPVYAGDVIQCVVTITQYEPNDRFVAVNSTFVCTNQNKKQVLSGSAKGIIRHPAAAPD